MPAPASLCQILGINIKNFTKEENILLEAEFFTRLCEKMEFLFKDRYLNYFGLIKTDLNKEIGMREDNLIYCVVNDILSSKVYTLNGIALYTNTPEEVIYEAAIGSNKTPSANLLRKVIELHREVRPELYFAIMEKIAMEFLSITKVKLDSV